MPSRTSGIVILLKRLWPLLLCFLFGLLFVQTGWLRGQETQETPSYLPVVKHLVAMGTPTATAVFAPTLTVTPSASAMPTGTATATGTATITTTPTATATGTQSPTPTASVTPTPSATITPTETRTPTATATGTQFPTATATVTNTPSPSPTATATTEATATPKGPLDFPESTTLLPVGQTTPVEDDADDPTIWHHPTDVNKSLIIGTDKGSETIYVWDIDGEVVQTLPQHSKINNVDLRGDIVAWNIRDSGKLGVARVNSSQPDAPLEQLADAESSNNDIQDDSYGFALYQEGNKLYVFERPTDSGLLKQYEIEIDNDTVTVTPVRTLTYGGGQAEGMVADDEHGWLYVAEEECCVHKYYASPSASTSAVSTFAYEDGIIGQREGMAIYKTTSSDGYILMSSQGDSTLKAYDRATNAFLGTIITEGAIWTDGIDVSVALDLIVVHHSDGAQFLFYRFSDIFD